MKALSNITCTVIVLYMSCYMYCMPPDFIHFVVCMHLKQLFCRKLGNKEKTVCGGPR